MALMTKCSFVKTLLELQNPDQGMYATNHIFEPEFHQDIYVKACESARLIPGAFQVGRVDLLERSISRGTQPEYADDETDSKTLQYEGMVLCDGNRLHGGTEKLNVCVLKSNCIRNGYIDLSLARSTDQTFFAKVKDRASVQRNDVLINSTGDGSIGRVAVYNYDFPAIVDGHITIVRYKDKKLAWYVAAFLLTEMGQNQIYRYINGSSGQVEIYPQDISRIWVKPANPQKIEDTYQTFKNACEQHDMFFGSLNAIVHGV